MAMDHRFKEYDWSIVMELLVAARDEWRCCTVDGGEQFVTVVGTLLKLELPAGEKLHFPFKVSLEYCYVHKLVVIPCSDMRHACKKL